jgi:hypothetical protein
MSRPFGHFTWKKIIGRYKNPYFGFFKTNSSLFEGDWRCLEEGDLHDRPGDNVITLFSFVTDDEA